MADPLSISASIVTILQLTKDVISYLNEARNAPKDRQELRDDLTSTAYYLYMLKDAAEEAAPRHTAPSSLASLLGDHEPLTQFRTTLSELTAKLQPKGHSKSSMSAITWPFHKPHVEEILRKMERCKSLIIIALQAENLYVK